ncbi:MAG: hypothetical protein MRQ13_03985 [Candidatus Midichloria sp.]|nr:hypothetical protein [Candidatus Midichloria sp.]
MADPSGRTDAGQVYIVYAGLWVEKFMPSVKTTTTPTTTTVTTITSTLSLCTPLSKVKEEIFSTFTLIRTVKAIIYG